MGFSSCSSQSRSFLHSACNALRGPITRAVTDATGRELSIEGDLKPVWSWIHPRIRAEGVKFANADWGKASYLLDAEAIEATISLLPLLRGRVVLPEVHLERAELSLEQDIDGRKNWIMEKQPEPKEESRFFDQAPDARRGPPALGGRVARAQHRRRPFDRRDRRAVQRRR